MGNRIRELRKILGLNQDELGKKIGITNTAVSKLEKGERNITEQVVLSICREFNVNEEWLRNGNGEMFTPHDIDEDLAFAFGQISAVKNDELKKALLLLTELTDEQIIYIANMVKALKDDNK